MIKFNGLWAIIAKIYLSIVDWKSNLMRNRLRKRIEKQNKKYR